MVYNYSYEKTEDKKIKYCDYEKHSPEKLKGENIYVTEMFDGIDAKIYVKEDQTMKFIYNKSLENEKNDYLLVLNTYFKEKIRLLGSLFNKVEFVIFCKCINYENSKIKYFDGNKTMIFTDLYINENWLLQDDIYKYFVSFQLPTPEILYEGVFDEKTLKYFVESYKGRNNKTNLCFGFSIKDEFEEGFAGSKEREIIVLKSESTILLEDLENYNINIFIDSFLETYFFPLENEFIRIKEFASKFEKEIGSNDGWYKKKIIEECIDYVFPILLFSLNNNSVNKKDGFDIKK